MLVPPVVFRMDLGLVERENGREGKVYIDSGRVGESRHTHFRLSIYLLAGRVLEDLAHYMLMLMLMLLLRTRMEWNGIEWDECSFTKLMERFGKVATISNYHEIEIRSKADFAQILILYKL